MDFWVIPAVLFFQVIGLSVGQHDNVLKVAIHVGVYLVFDIFLVRVWSKSSKQRKIDEHELTKFMRKF